MMNTADEELRSSHTSKAQLLDDQQDLESTVSDDRASHAISVDEMPKKKFKDDEETHDDDEITHAHDTHEHHGHGSSNDSPTMKMVKMIFSIIKVLIIGIIYVAFAVIWALYPDSSREKIFAVSNNSPVALPMNPEEPFSAVRVMVKAPKYPDNFNFAYTPKVPASSHEIRSNGTEPTIYPFLAFTIQYGFPKNSNSTHEVDSSKVEWFSLNDTKYIYFEYMRKDEDGNVYVYNPSHEVNTEALVREQLVRHISGAKKFNLLHLWDTVKKTVKKQQKQQLALNREEEKSVLDDEGEYFLREVEFEPDEHTLEKMASHINVRVVMETDMPYTVPVTLKVTQHNVLFHYKVLIAAFILIGVYALIVFELVHRTLAAMLSAFICLSVMAVVGERPPLEEIVQWIEYDTLGLLFGMMVMVAIFSRTGFFEFSALIAYKLSRGNLFVLYAILCSFTAFVSAFLDNVTTMLLVAPVTIRLCKVLGISPIPMIIGEVLLSNIGGTATAVGDPPIVIIVNHPDVQARGVTFLDISLYLAPGVLVSAVLTIFLLRFLSWGYFRDYSLKMKAQKEKERMRQEQEMELELEAQKQQVEVNSEEISASAVTPTSKKKNEEAEVDAQAAIAQMEKTYRIHNVRLFVICMLILSIVILFFFTEAVIERWLHVSLAWTACIGATAMLIFSDVHDLDHILEKVEWGTLLFFAALFILMRGLEELGLIDWIGTQTANLILLFPLEYNVRLLAGMTILIWISAFVSAFIDNIPYTAAMIPVVLKLAGPSTSLPLFPLLWALTYGTCFGGNGSLIGASANVVSAGICESNGYHISFAAFLKLGLPTMIFTIAIANVYLVFVHGLFGLGLARGEII